MAKQDKSTGRANVAVSGTRGLAERVIEGPDGCRVRVQVNLGESPVSWLFARRLLTRRQYDAAETIRRDWEQAAMGPRVTMNWDSAAAQSQTQRGAPAALERNERQLSAKDRLNGALAAAGPGLCDIAWRVACAGESLGGAEQALGWPNRAAKLVLGFALDRVADFYRIN